MECPELRKVKGGDEIGYICKLVDKWCLKEYGQPCEEYDKIMKYLYPETVQWLISMANIPERIKETNKEGR